MTPAPARRALIVGGSMAGLFAAHYLRRAGWQADVYERTAVPLSARGAGILTHPELWAALYEIGMDPGGDFGVPITTRAVLARDDGVLATLYRPQIATSWTHIHGILADKFPSAHYHYCADLTAIQQHGGMVTARFADGRQATGELLIGADGFRSTVRRLLFPEVSPIYAGYVAWRGLLPEAALHDVNMAQRASLFAFNLPPGEHMVGYLIAGPCNDLRPGQRSYNFVWYRPADVDLELPVLLTDAQGRRHDLAIPPHLITPAVIAEMRDQAQAILAPWFQAVVARTPQPFLQPIYDLAVPRMAEGRVALIGDAAFVVRPHVGAGVVKGAQDAAALADAVQADDADIPAALSAFSRQRHAAGAKMIAQARRLGCYLTHSFASDSAHTAAFAQSQPDVVLRETGSLEFLDA